MLQNLTQQLLTERSEKKEFMEMLEQEGRELQSVIANKEELEIRLEGLLQKVGCPHAMPGLQVVPSFAVMCPSIVLMFELCGVLPLDQRAGDGQAGTGALQAGCGGSKGEFAEAAWLGNRDGTQP